MKLNRCATVASVLNNFHPHIFWEKVLKWNRIIMIILLIYFIYAYCTKIHRIFDETNMRVDWKYFKDHKYYIKMDNPGSNLVVLIERRGDFPYFTYCFIVCAIFDGIVVGYIGAIEININLITNCIILLYPSIKEYKI